MATKAYTIEQVASHKSADDAWVVVNGKVYDVTKFLDDHPGGKKVLLKNCGKDASKQFEQFHSGNVLEKYGPKLLIGEVSPSSKL
ncbi:uncharacterized protein SPPG_00175 [Spizellomyces punctatus DAOM BR117]|uniref:Cytochrome b5 heme-binding domain-containing protein n=1 Tax=Spizellomyces punctatus (strain DAOM BR117) TaxID=645134 RepID=A0A0L0HSV8_SPIPD|nr:uncharacterized protein SPPG_00175 [Spizellomyces punctatus DAOM BR117]KND04446.1 hypothetical protein SPPG_00175 [Spizellomyces punctatus DAOM BR117]|eukprot:XP_016612485.1 hypothetical protein SPPG_00175 [Spizellomyces punctatus DAOM BR117]